MASFALPLRSQAMAGGQITQKPRGFLDLPIEIRDRIYKELLCKFHIDERNDAAYAFEKTEDYTIVRPHIHPEILRSNHGIHDEATAVMRINNLFFHVNAPIGVLDPWVIACELPLVQFNTGGKFKGVVVIHTVTALSGQKVKMSGKLFHLRDFGKFIEALQSLVRDVPKPDHTETFREDLAKPYCNLRGFKHFDITGIPEVLAKAVKKQVTSPKSAISPTVILAELVAMKAKGNEAWGFNNEGEANNHWCDALDKLHNTLKNNLGKTYFANGGTNFQRSILSLEFSLYFNIVQARLEKIRAFKASGAPPDIIYDVGERSFQLLNAARICMYRWEVAGNLWEPTTLQMAKLSFREAVVCRQIGRVEFLGRAESAIADALRTLPYDRAVLEEQDKIKQWRRAIS